MNGRLQAIKLSSIFFFDKCCSPLDFEVIKISSQIFVFFKEYFTSWIENHKNYLVLIINCPWELWQFSCDTMLCS